LKHLDRLACPDCGAALASTADAVTCPSGHRFRVTNGIPRFIAGGGADQTEAIRRSFTSEWDHYDYDTDRIWGQSLAERREIALRELDCKPEDLAGKLVLDAGCGAGMVSYQFSKMGAEVVAADVSDSVDAARAQLTALGVNRQVEFIQADLARPPLKPAQFDVVFSSGVLHHNPSTRAALDAIAPLVAPGGQIYVWLYGSTPGLAHKVRAIMRRIIVPLPPKVQRRIFSVWTLQSIGRQRLRRVTGRGRRDDGVTYREKMLILLDHYTPRYRWEHTPEELSGWYRELGFTDVKTTERTHVGFGVLARRPS
jgi:SAM-dependent methyltransferase